MISTSFEVLVMASKLHRGAFETGVLNAHQKRVVAEGLSTRLKK